MYQGGAKYGKNEFHKNINSHHIHVHHDSM